MSINGYLNLGTAVVSGAVVPPSSGAGYAPQFVNFDTFPGGATLNGVSCLFGPLTAPWGTLTCFSVTDVSGNTVVPPGTLQSPFTPQLGQYVTVPQGSITLVLGSQFSAQPGFVVTSTPAKGATVSGSVALSSGAYTLVLASGLRNLLVLSNTDGGNTVRVILGGTQPASGANGYSLIQPWGTFPPPSMAEFVPTDAIWALASGPGQTLNYLTG